MSDDRPQTQDCLDAETLAAFIDGRLEPRAREAVEAHLAECEDCYEVWMETGTTAVDSRSALGVPSRRSVFLALGFRYVAGAAAAAILVVGGLYTFRALQNDPHRAVSQLAEAVGARRPSVGRLSVPFGYAEAPDVTRGPGSSALPAAVLEHTVGLRLLAERNRTPAALWGAGVALLTEGDVNTAITFFEESLAANPSDLRVRVDIAAAYLERLRRGGRPDDASRALSAVTFVLERTPNSAAALFNRALALEGIGLTAEARMAWSNYLKADDSSPWADEARRHLARQPPAPEAAARAIDHLRTALTSWAEAEIDDRHFDLLLAEQDSRHYESMVLRRALSLPRSHARSCLARYLAADAAWREAHEHERYADAASAADLQMQMSRCAGISSLGSLVNTAFTAFAVSGTADGLRELSASRAQLESTNDWRTAARISILEALTALQRSEFDVGVKAYQKCIDLSERGHELELRVWCRARLAAVLDDQGQGAMSWPLLQLALSELHHVRSSKTSFLVLSAAIIMAERAQHPGTVWVLGEVLLSHTRQWQSGAGAVFAHSRRARASASIDGRHVSAELAMARAAVERLVDPSKAEIQQSELDLLEGELFLTSDPARSITALTSGIALLEERANGYRSPRLLLARGRAYEALGQRRSAEKDWQHAADLLSGQLSTIADPAVRAARLDLLWDVFDRLIMIRRDRVADALQTLEWSRTVSSQAGIVADVARRLDVAELQRQLPPTATVLVFASLSDRLLRWTISRSDLTLDELELGSRDLQVQVDRVVDAVRTSDSSSEALQSFAQVLIPARLHQLPPETLVIIPDGALNRLSMAALRLGSRAMVERTVPVLAPSLTAFLSASANQWTPDLGGRVMISGNARQDDSGNLPGVDVERAAMLRHYGPAMTFVDAAVASRFEIIAAIVPAGLLQVSGHAIADYAIPGRSRLMLSTTNHVELSLHDLRRLPLRSGALIVLSSCETAAGAAYRGDGPQTLVRPFLDRGASGVVGTLWPVEDRAAASITISFHQSLTTRHPSLALAFAQRQMIAQGRPVAAWAGFAYFGGINLDAHSGDN